MPGIEIKGRSKIANYRHGGRTGKFGGGRTNLLEQLGRVEAEPSNPNRRAEISRVHGELNRGYKDGGRTGFKLGTPKSGGAAKKRKIEQTKAVKRLTTSDKAYSPKKLIVEAFKRRGTKGAGTGTAEAITDWHNIREEAKKVQKRLPGSTVTVRSQRERVPRRGLGWKVASKRRSPYSPPQPQKPLPPPTIQPRQATIERRAEGGRIGLKEGTDKKWMQKVSASIKKRGTKGKCTPITKPGCTGRAKALAKTFKKIAAKRKA